MKTNKDLIERQAAIKSIKTSRFLVDAMEKIIKLPPARQNIIRCKECIHWKHSDVRKNYCEVFDWTNTAEDFCSFAERRTDEQTD